MNKVLGFERINERRQRPNKFINFIKPLEGIDEDLAQDFLERIAAICYPIMKANHVVVMSLEEFPPNKEFLGRNFNAGEIIQLVLKAPSGQWYPFKHVQMVMMHELAHCKQMNHSRDFWKVNNANRDELKALWARNYTGEGLWGRGQTLLSGRYTNDHMPDAAEAPSNLCGGTYRSRGGKKRKRGGSDAPQLSYAERKQRRIAKKFGVNGQTLGADEYARFGLDQGRHRPSKPRVAGSKRGRELRVAAALARFDKVKQEGPKQEGVDVSDDGDEYETDSDDEAGVEEIGGNWDDNDNLVKVCENEDLDDDGDAQREMNEFRQIDQQPSSSNATKTTKAESDPRYNDTYPSIKVEPDGHSKEAEKRDKQSKAQSKQRQKSRTIALEEDTFTHARQAPLSVSENVQPPKPTSVTKAPAKTTARAPPASSQQPPKAAGPILTPNTTPCQICSFENEKGAATCMVCSHVMDTDKIKNVWRCQSSACEGSAYLNLGDYGRCGVCGEARLESGGSGVEG